MLADADLEMFFRHTQAYSLVPLPFSWKKTSPRSCWPFSPSPIVSKRYGPELNWPDLQSCLAKPDLDLLTPNWPEGAWAINANGYVPCDFIVACYSAIADQYQHLQGSTVLFFPGIKCMTSFLHFWVWAYLLRPLNFICEQPLVREKFLNSCTYIVHSCHWA